MTGCSQLHTVVCMASMELLGLEHPPLSSFTPRYHEQRAFQIYQVQLHQRWGAPDSLLLVGKGGFCVESL